MLQFNKRKQFYHARIVIELLLLHFLSRCSKLYFYSLGTRSEENMGCSEGGNPL